MSSTLSGYRGTGTTVAALQGEPSPGSAVSWPAVFAGAVASAAFSLILLLLGTGLGLTSISPWSDRGASAAAFGFAAIVWILVTQIMSSGLGGYVAGRLRVRWSGVHSDEVFFRDTVHGFLAWCVGTLVSAVLLASAVSSAVSGGAKAVATVAQGAATVAAAAAPAASGGAPAYVVDSLFRRDPNATSAPPSPSTPVPLPEVTRIFAHSLPDNALPPEDVRYVGQLVAERSGLAQADAEKRVTDTYARTQAQLKAAEAQAKEAADKARKATIYATLWLFVSLLAGAFSASWLATFGGRERDL
jgi:hypothetical protein